MTLDFTTALARATEQVRLNDPFAATRTIQAALNGGASDPLDAARDIEPRACPASTHRSRGPRLDPDAEIVEPSQPQDATTAAAGSSGRKRESLAAVIRTLREGRGRLGLTGLEPQLRPGPRAAPDIPEGARFEARRFASPHGARGYKLYVPSTGQANGLVVMLHGCKQNPDDFAAGTGMNAQAEAQGLIVVYPHQTNGENAAACWNWFLPAHQIRDSGEPAIIAGITREVMAEFDIAPARVFAAGLSAGGAMAAVLGETFPDLFSAIGVHSGLGHGTARDVVTAFAAMRGDAPPVRPVRTGTRGRRVIVFHGTADRTVHPDNGTRIVDAARAGSQALVERKEQGRSAGGAAYTRRTFADAEGRAQIEAWSIDGAGHAWAGGDARGSYTDPRGPDASAEMVRFFLGGN